MTLPKHIQDGLDKAIELQKQITEGNTAEPAPGTPESQALKQDAGVVKDVKIGDGVDNEDQNQIQDTPEEPEPTQKPKDEDVEHWKQKFRTLEGKYNAEVPRYAADVRQLKQNLSLLQRELEGFKSQKKQEPAPELGDINPADYEEYGEDMQKLASQISQLMKTVNSLKSENDSLKTQVGSVYKATEQTSYDAFLDRVKQAYPAFDEQDRDPEFINWVDDMSIDLQTIGKNRDVNKAVEVYKAYAQVTGKYQPVSQEPSARNPSVQRQVAPPKSRPAPPSDMGQQKQKMWTRAEINKTYADIQSGIYTEQQALELKQQIFNAQKDGRIE